MALATPAAPSHAARAQASGCTGVTVVVDFASLGGGDQTRCAAGDPASGVAALRGAGFEPTRAAQEAGYFVCRIDGKPADDPCQRASPEDAYWSYWHAQPGGTWSFSNAGAADYDPEPGSVEGWAFGAGDPPSTPPPAAPRRSEASPAAAAPAPSAPRRAPRTTQATAPTTAPRTPVPAVPSPAASPAAPARASAAPSPVRSVRASPVPTASPEQVTPLTVDDPAPGDDGGPLVGVLLAVAVVAGLGAAAAFQAQRRR